MGRLGLSLILLLAGGGAAAADAVTWGMAIGAPGVMPEGPFAGQGASEAGMHVLAEALPQFEWRFETAMPLRVLNEMSHRDGVCSYGFARLPERERLMVFSNRPMIVPGYGVILRRDRATEFRKFLDASGSVDLASLGAASGLIGGYVPVRPHFGSVKAFIEARRDNPALVGDSDTVRLFRQLQAGHVDYLFALRDEANYFAEALGGDTAFDSVPIAGTDQTGLAYIACSAGAVGRRAMSAIDAYLADDAHWAAFTAPWRRWLSPEDFAAALKSPIVR